MIDVSRIYWQKINEIQSRLPVKLNVRGPALPSDMISARAPYANSFQSSLHRAVESQEQDSAAGNATFTNAATLLGYNNLLRYNNAYTSDSAEREYIENVIDDASQKYQVNPNLVRAIVKAESNFNPNVVSSAGAMGVMQLMPGTAQGMGVEDPFDIVQNINAGVKLIKGHLDNYDGDLSLALAAYNAGSGAVRKYGGVPPYTETQNYIEKVIKYFKEYNAG